MNYLKVYNNFIKDRLENKNGKVLSSNKANSKLNFIGYCEMHHIIPKCYGGDNSKSNLILLSASDHVFAHMLLAKIYKGKMVYALRRLLNGKCYNMNNSLHISNKRVRKLYGYVKENMKGKNAAAYGHKCTDEHKLAISKANSGAKNGMYGKPGNNLVCKEHVKEMLRRPIKQLDKQGSLINTFRGIDIAAKETNSARTKIVTVAKGIGERGRKYCNDFIWAYFDETYADGTSCKLSLSKYGVVVHKLDDHGNIIRTYEGVVAASKAENMSRSAIARRCDNINNKNWIKENIK